MTRDFLIALLPSVPGPAAACAAVADESGSVLWLLRIAVDY